MQTNLNTLKEKLGKFNSTSPMFTRAGNVALNQTILNFENGRLFQSYESIIVIELMDTKTFNAPLKITYIGEDWEYSKTTAQYRNNFLHENTAETQAKIDNGTYSLITY